MMLDLIGGLCIFIIMLAFTVLFVAITDDIMLDNVIGEHLTKKLKKRLGDD